MEFATSSHYCKNYEFLFQNLNQQKNLLLKHAHVHFLQNKTAVLLC